MINSVSNNNFGQVNPSERQPQLDPMIERRVEQSRQLALEALRDEHAQKVRVAVAAFSTFYESQSSNPKIAVEQANRAYEQY